MTVEAESDRQLFPLKTAALADLAVRLVQQQPQTTQRNTAMTIISNQTENISITLPEYFSTADNSTIPDPHPTPEIRSRQSQPSYWVPETHRITAVDPNRSEELFEVRVELVERREQEESILILLTNNDSLAFVCNVVKAELGSRYLVQGIIDNPGQAIGLAA